MISYDLVCFSHLRWDFVFQRPQHLMSRIAADHRVYFIEEPIYDTPTPYLEVKKRTPGIQVLVSHLPDERDYGRQLHTQDSLLTNFLNREGVRSPVLWYYTPMALDWTPSLEGSAIVYDCMDELSAFAGAPPELKAKEAELLLKADVVFTGGQSLYEFKKTRHNNVHAVPSSVDINHFASARVTREDPPDQSCIAHPRLGFYGVLDERLDIELLAGIADLRRSWQYVLIGPVVKIDPASLPWRPNIHYLGAKSYADLPSYVAGWDAALLLFARNEATRFISPTKTPEYLAAGKPVVSTSIRDVVAPYGERGLALIADTPADFVAAVESAWGEDENERLHRADEFLSGMSWDRTWAVMEEQIERVLRTSAHRASENRK